MTNLTMELDKTWMAGVGEADSYGTVMIRVVVVPPKQDKDAPGSPDPDEPLADVGGAPLDSYLERPRGKGYVVLLVHGQRHDALDEGFVHHDLAFKYLRTRTMIVIDVDGLAPEAISDLVQGSRQGMYKGKVYDAIVDRVIKVLKKDPDLMRLELDAEQKIAELKTGDESVRRKLDELIEGHHFAGQQNLPGAGTKGIGAGVRGESAGDVAARDVVVAATPDVGEPGSEPVLIAEPNGETVRLHPDEEKSITIRAVPSTEWANLESKDLKVTPVIPELQMSINEAEQGAVLKLRFADPDMQIEDYPIKGKLTFFASFNGSAEPRIVERSLFIAPKVSRPPTLPPLLTDKPTFLKVASRQPIKLIPGGPSTHVRLKWDGEDHLASGWPPSWSFSARCLSLESFPAMIFSKPRGGKLELLLDTPHGLLTGQQLEFEVEAKGPDGLRLVTLFTGEVVEPAPIPEARKKKEEAPAGSSQRRRPYEIKVIHESEWDSPCWDSSKWTEHDAGCFEEPTSSSLLTLIINEDAAVLKKAREQMLAKQLDEPTIQERLGRYTAHICFHLYNMYEYAQEMKQLRETDESAHVPDDAELRAEINRVALTLSGLMDR
jgi:hypothetical protein